MTKIEFLEEFIQFMKSHNYSALTQDAYLSDVEQFITFAFNKNYSYQSNLDFIYKLSKKDFTDFIAFLKEKHISACLLNRKYFAIKVLALFLSKNYYTDFDSKIYIPALLHRSDKIIINNFMLEVKDAIITYKYLDYNLIFNFMIFYLSIALKIPHKKIVKLNKQDIGAYYNYIVLLNKKLKCHKDACFIFKHCLDQIGLNKFNSANFDSKDSKLFNISYQASIVISRNFLLSITNNIDNGTIGNNINLNSHNLNIPNNNNQNLTDNTSSNTSSNISVIYKKIHPRS